MRTRMMSAVAAGLVAALFVGGAGIAAGSDKIQLRGRDQLRDGSCEVSAVKAQKRDRLKDGSCEVAAIKAQKRDRLKDGSCEIAGTKARLRTRDC